MFVEQWYKNNRLLIAALLVVIWSALTVGPVTADTGTLTGSVSILTDAVTAGPQVRPSSSEALNAICRVGVSAWGEQLADYNLISQFGVGWYLDFGAGGGNAPAMQDAEYAHILALSQDRPDDPADENAPVSCGPDYGYTISPRLTDSGLGTLVDQNPGELWIIGNEPDRRNVQNDICPQQYAQAYHDAYHFIKARDPSAQVAIAGLVEVTPGRMQYLDIVWNTYRQKYGATLPVDVWTFHVYILSETNNGDAHIALGTDPNSTDSAEFRLQRSEFVLLC